MRASESHGKRGLRILVIDDEKVVRDFLCRFLELDGARVSTAQEGVEALALAREVEFDVIFMEINLPGVDGLQVLSELKAIRPRAAYVIMAGKYTDMRIDEALCLGAMRCFKKPFDLEEMRSLLQKIRDQGSC